MSRTSPSTLQKSKEQRKKITDGDGFLSTPHTLNPRAWGRVRHQHKRNKTAESQFLHRHHLPPEEPAYFAWCLKQIYSQPTEEHLLRSVTILPVSWFSFLSTTRKPLTPLLSLIWGIAPPQHASLRQRKDTPTPPPIFVLCTSAPSSSQIPCSGS